MTGSGTPLSSSAPASSGGTLVDLGLQLSALVLRQRRVHLDVLAARALVNDAGLVAVRQLRGVFTLQPRQIRLVRMYAITGPMNTAYRAISVVGYSEMLKWSAMTSFAPSSHKTPYQVMTATPMAVRVAALRGRSLT